MKLFLTNLNNGNERLDPETFLTLIENCEGRQSCFHTMECNINNNQDDSSRISGLFKLYLIHDVVKASVLVLKFELCGFSLKISFVEHNSKCMFSVLVSVSEN